MIYLNCGVKGSGKTKILVNLANEKVKQANGNLVYIDSSRDMTFALNNNIRFVDLSEFRANNLSKIFGIVCGIIAKDYDVEGIFIDSLLRITKEDLKDSKEFFEDLDKVSENFHIDLYINISSSMEKLPDFLRKYEFINN